jgi:ERCC4-related helicase
MQTEISYFNHPFLKKNRVLYRQYQNNIIERCVGRNSLIVLPTGLGKTIIGILLISEALKKYSKSKIIILAPTRPLVSQHKASCEDFLNIDSTLITSFTGKISPEKRILLFNNSKIIVSTPQVIKNDVERGRYDLKYVSLIIFDEAHRARGNYAYCFISAEYINSCQDPLILGLTASPGKSYIRIQQLCDQLFIENVIFKTYQDKDVKPYIYDIDMYLEFVDLPLKVVELSGVWYNLFEKFLKFFYDKNLLPPNKRYYSKLDFLGISRDLTLSLKYESGYLPELSEEDYFNALYFKTDNIRIVVKDKSLNIQSIFSYCSSCISLLHGKDLLESQNITLFLKFLEKIEWKAEQDILSAKRIVNSEHFKFIKNNLFTVNNINDYSHPKIEKLFSIINEEIENYRNNKMIVFTQYRAMADLLKNLIEERFESRLRVEKFIGQSTKINDLGFSQDKQFDIIKQFKEGMLDVIVATSVAEEGLDIPNVDAIIFYEPVPSEIRLIQRRGRTGRYGDGRCYLLIARQSIDVPFYKAAERKELAMNSVLCDSEKLDLCDNINREQICFKAASNKISEYDLIKNYKERRIHEKELLANRSIEEIITELDNFAHSEDFKRFKDVGVTFYSDVIRLDKLKLKTSIIKLEGKQKEKYKKMPEKKIYLNHNVKTLIRIAKTYSVDGKMSFSDFKAFAEEESIIEKKFYAHLNQACYLGYLKKTTKEVQFIKDYD